ncbi:MAG: HEAT repeat domain-containing protein [Cyanobacteria bacterium J06632_22]
MMSPEQCRWYETQLRSQALNERKAALDRLATESADEAIPILQALAQGDVFQRRLAMMGFANHLTDEAFAVLNTLIEQETDGNVLAEAANSLFDFGEKALPLLASLFEANTNWLLRQTILALMMAQDDPALLFDLAVIGLEDDTQTVKETAILALRQVWNSEYQSQALAMLADQAQSNDWRDRWRTATALTGCSAPAAKTLLAQLRQDSHHRVVAAALDAGVAGV